jgi:hypothetical protein
VCSIVSFHFENLPKLRPLGRTKLNQIINTTQRRIRKRFFSHYFCFVFFRKNIIRERCGNQQYTNKKIKVAPRKSQGNRNVSIFKLRSDVSDVGTEALKFQRH